MFGAIKYQLANLLNFNGRDARQTFWYWVLAVYVSTVIVNIVVTMPIMVRNMFQAMRTATQMADEKAAQEVMNHAMAGSMEPVIWLSIAMGVAMMLLFAASFVRRLHDSGLSGRWALIPAAFQVAGLVAMPGQMAKVTDFLDKGPDVASNPMAYMQGQLGYSAIAWIAIIALIVLGVRKSEPDPNRFGEDSVRF